MSASPANLKAEPNMFDEPSEKVLPVTDAMIRDSFNWFTGLVEERRGLNPQQMVADLGRSRLHRPAGAGREADRRNRRRGRGARWLEKRTEYSARSKSVDWKPKTDNRQPAVSACWVCG